MLVFRRNARKAFRTIGIDFDYVRSLDTKTPQISRELFGLESQNITRTSIPILSTDTLDTMSGSILSEVKEKKLSKISTPTASGAISRERFKLGSRYFQTYRGQSASQTCRKLRH